LDKLKLFMEDFNPVEGIISYSVENENGDRIARSQYQDESIKTYSPETMDFFLLGYLAQLEKLDTNLEVQGPISKGLLNLLDNNKISALDIVDVTKRVYTEKELNFFRTVFYETQDLNKTLSGVFNYYN
jgi:hypothetical protein